MKLFRRINFIEKSALIYPALLNASMVLFWFIFMRIRISIASNRLEAAQDVRLVCLLVNFYYIIVINVINEWMLLTNL